MLLVGLTGGIGSGKSTVADLLAARGAVILDADAFAREAVEPGTRGFEAVVERFGRSIVGADGRLDRPALASIVFADPERLRELEAIVHPEVRRMTAERLAAHADTDDVVVLVNPILIEMGDHERCNVVVVVTATPETRVARVVARGMDEADARARLAAQMPSAEQSAVADVVIDNEGTPVDLEHQVDGLWSHLTERARA
ncbi:MAG TPA: dephospho-CoA kinase [Actinomycetota bacterium]